MSVLFFQGLNLFPALRAQETVELVLHLKGITSREARLRALTLLTEVGSADKAHSHPVDPSGGHKQRVAIARALAGDPSIIFADEPGHGLARVSEIQKDVAARKAMPRGHQ